MKRLETAVHALVKEERLKFLRGSMDLPEKIVVLDVPLLFETKMESQVLESPLVRRCPSGFRGKRTRKCF